MQLHGRAAAPGEDAQAGRGHAVQRADLPGAFHDEVVDAPLPSKLARFGASLHMRVFGADVLQQTLGMVFRIPDRYDLTERFGELVLAEANIPPHHWRAFTGASIFRVTRDDLRI